MTEQLIAAALLWCGCLKIADWMWSAFDALRRRFGSKRATHQRPKRTVLEKDNAPSIEAAYVSVGECCLCHDDTNCAIGVRTDKGPDIACPDCAYIMADTVLVGRAA